MSPKANGPTALPAVDTIQHQGFFARLTSCFRKQNVGANGRVMPSHTVSRYYFILFTYNISYQHVLIAMIL